MTAVTLFLSFSLNCDAKLEVFSEICNIFAKKMQKKMKIIGIGNALVDILTLLENDLVLEGLNLERGGMSLIDDVKHSIITGMLNELHPAMATGGSAGNTVLALAQMHTCPGFVGKIGMDNMGRFFSENCSQVGINATLLEGEEATGVANTFISQDGERTFATHLGAAATMKAEDVRKEWFEGYDLLYLEGYLVQNHELIECIVQTAKAMGLKIAIDLASFTVVRDNLGFMRRLVKEYVDIVFSNEEESAAFTGGLNADKALEELAEITEVAVVKLGGKGSSAMCAGKKYAININKVEVTDTTAAGDFYAGGFLYAYSQGADIETCLRCGSLLASEVVQVVGTRLTDETWETIRCKAQALVG